MAVLRLAPKDQHDRRLAPLLSLLCGLGSQTTQGGFHVGGINEMSLLVALIDQVHGASTI